MGFSSLVRHPDLLHCILYSEIDVVLYMRRRIHVNFDIVMHVNQALPWTRGEISPKKLKK